MIEQLPEVSMTLTPREIEVMDLVSLGLTNKVIAGRMNIATETVKEHVSNAMSKTGSRSRTHLATWRARGVLRFVLREKKQDMDQSVFKYLNSLYRVLGVE